MNLLKVHRIWQHAQRFLGSQQTYDEIFAKYQGAQAQYIAVQAELDKAKKRRGSSNNNGSWPKGKSWRIAGSRNRDQERYIVAPRT
jgi:HlyD family secretion protein